MPWYDGLRLITSNAGRNVGMPDLLRAIIDVSDWLAARTDKGSLGADREAATSLSFAQLSVIVLQAKLLPLADHHHLELAMTDRHRRLSWYVQCLSPTPGTKGYHQYFSYGDSRCILFNRLFKPHLSSAGLPLPVRLWTANWRAFDWARRNLVGLLSYIDVDHFGDVPESFEEEIRRSAWRLAETARNGFTASISILGPAAISGSRESEVDRLIDLLAKFYDNETGSADYRAADRWTSIFSGEPAHIRF